MWREISTVILNTELQTDMLTILYVLLDLNYRSSYKTSSADNGISCFSSEHDTAVRRGSVTAGADVGNKIFFTFWRRDWQTKSKLTQEKALVPSRLEIAGDNGDFQKMTWWFNLYQREDIRYTARHTTNTATVLSSPGRKGGNDDMDKH